MKINESLAWSIRKHYFIEFINNTFAADYLYPVCIALKSIKSIVINHKIQLSSESYTTQHTKWIIRECYIWIKRSTDNTVFHIKNTVKWINKFAKAFFI